jgi:hypothetical protein
VKCGYKLLLLVACSAISFLSLVMHFYIFVAINFGYTVYIYESNAILRFVELISCLFGLFGLALWLKWSVEEVLE